MDNKKYRVVGVMSGTSLDGLDLALCNFVFADDRWSFEIEEAVTIGYSQEWKNKLELAQELSAFDFVKLHREYGKYIGEKVKYFTDGKGDVDFIASHGHTVFHKPEQDTTFQIGCGAYIAASSGCVTVSDFRTLDIAMGGQGAPLVPIGDKLLFSTYDACVNLGGFANISFEKASVRLAYDICPVNFVLNKILEDHFGQPYDAGGEKGRKGCADQVLLNKLDQLDYYNQDGPKSLAREWVELEFWPILDASEISIDDKLATVYCHFANQIAKVLKDNGLKRVLFTGGGAYNDFLIELIKHRVDSEILIPSKKVIDYKEALIFAFLGVLRYELKDNCLKSVTGAQDNNVGGCIYV